MTGALCLLHAACAAAWTRCAQGTARTANGHQLAALCDRGNSRQSHLFSSMRNISKHQMNMNLRWDRLGHALIGAADLQWIQQQQQPRRPVQQQQRALPRLLASQVRSTCPAAWCVTCQARRVPAAIAAARNERPLLGLRLLCQWAHSPMTNTMESHLVCERLHH
jgi:hypothetical protein